MNCQGDCLNFFWLFVFRFFILSLLYLLFICCCSTIAKLNIKLLVGTRHTFGSHNFILHNRFPHYVSHSTTLPFTQRKKVTIANVTVLSLPSYFYSFLYDFCCWKYSVSSFQYIFFEMSYFNLFDFTSFFDIHKVNIPPFLHFYWI